ncbi:MAG TPA: phosphate regulon transcriptional regulator PhoB [Acidiferrobacterales bacterium]|nr:phosphate regulon transcriptional regulator PhoB [Acidiferrobacterales bacterium]
MPGKILIVDDEAAICEMVSLALRQAGYECWSAADVAEAQNLIVAGLPDLILLDWMLPGISGVDYARRLRREKLTGHLPIIMLTARTHEEDKIKGLDTGADDYITKPFSPRELLARIKALLRRTAPLAADAPVEIERLALNPVTHRVEANGKPIELGATEFRLLHFFMSHSERVYSREQVLNNVWGQNVYIDERTIDVHIRRLRKALAPSGHDRLIQTVRGAGYRFSSQD